MKLFLFSLFFLISFSFFAQKPSNGDKVTVAQIMEENKKSNVVIIEEQGKEIQESQDLSVFRETFAMKGMEIQMGFAELDAAGKYDAKISKKVLRAFKAILSSFKKSNDGRFDVEISKITFLKEDFQEYTQLTGAEQVELLIIIRETWMEVNIDIMGALNKKFNQAQYIEEDE